MSASASSFKAFEAARDRPKYPSTKEDENANTDALYNLKAGAILYEQCREPSAAMVARALSTLRD